ASLSFTLDTTLAKTVVSLLTDSGTADDNITNSAALSLNTRASDVTRTYAINGAAATTTYTAPTQDGSYTVLVSDTDKAGNSDSASLSFTLDKTLKAPTVSLVSNTGSSLDSITLDASLKWSEPDADVTRTYVINGGASSSEYTYPTQDGTYELVVTDTDTAGNTKSAKLSFTLDTTLQKTALALLNDSGDSSDNITNSAVLAVSALADDTKRTYKVNGGAATATYTAPTKDGYYTVVVSDTDTAGSTETASLSFTLDKTLTSPTVVLSTDTGAGADKITSDASLSLNAPDEDASRTYALNGGASLSEYTAPTQDGAYTLVVTDTDTAGNIKSASLSFTLDTTLEPTVVSLLNGKLADSLTSSAALKLNTAAADVTRTYSINQINAISLAPATATYTAPTKDDEYFVVVTDTDTAGNTASARLNFTLDMSLTAPTVVLITDTGISADGITSNVSLSWNEPDQDAIRTYVINGGTSLRTYAEPTQDGAYALVVTDTDTAGNIKSASLSFTLDTTLAKTVVSLLTDSGTADDNITNSGQLLESSIASDVTRTYAINGAAATNSYTAPIYNGAYTVLVVDTDTAGNTDSARLSFTLKGAQEPVGKSINLQAYSWSSHTLLNDVLIDDGTTKSTTVAGQAQWTVATRTQVTLSAAMDTSAIGPAAIAASSAAVNLQDAIAILKMIVGLNVNGVNKPLSPYQVLAADTDGNGSVELNDAIGVLKYVVGLTQTQPAWHFVSELDTSVVAMENLKPGKPTSSIVASLESATPAHIGLVAYLTGDVDGSYTLGSNHLTQDYFTTLVGNHPNELSLSQFGIYT
ncbi:MAG: hypothetical protein EBR17_06445, partial [Betaproteobacteria bacterium]|nr:hypothetical protein [Betaproteobacteria bacterium]